MFKDSVDTIGMSSLTNANTPLYFASSTALVIRNTTQIQQALDYFAVRFPNCIGQGYLMNLRCSSIGAALPGCFPQQWTSHGGCRGTVFFPTFYQSSL